jgi:hypothetical protein
MIGEKNINQIIKSLCGAKIVVIKVHYIGGWYCSNKINKNIYR